jgi:hypothetical protein
VADFSDEGVALDDFHCTLRKRAAVPRPCKQPFDRRIGWTC